ncbi:MAG: hypothetical protein ACRCX2_33905 [Paraclostridium sp.]
MFNPLNNLNDARMLINKTTGVIEKDAAKQMAFDAIYLIVDFFKNLFTDPFAIIVPLIKATRPYLIVALIVLIVMKSMGYDIGNKITTTVILILLSSLFI